MLTSRLSVIRWIRKLQKLLFKNLLIRKLSISLGKWHLAAPFFVIFIFCCGEGGAAVGGLHSETAILLSKTVNFDQRIHH